MTVLVPVQAVVVDVITRDLPASALAAVRKDACLSGLQLTDPNFDRPGRIDLLLGVNVLPRVMLEGRIHSTDYSLSVTRSVYGWVVTGTCKSLVQVPRFHLCLKTSPLDQQTQDLLTRFWQVEDVISSSSIRTEEEQTALEHFRTTHSRQSDGRYVVVLSRKSTTLSLGGSREQAVRRFHQNHKSLSRKGKWEEFIEAVRDYSIRGHAERVPVAELIKPETDMYYLPMHGVRSVTQ